MLTIADVILLGILMFYHPGYRPLDPNAFQLVESGYSEIAIDTNIYWVTYSTNHSDDASTYSLYRAAELAKYKGYSDFVLMDSSEESIGSFIMPQYFATKTIRMLSKKFDSAGVRSFNANDVMAAMPRIVEDTNEK